MLLKKLKLVRFRNISLMELSFNPGITIFYGSNGQGKTNIAEAIYLLASGSSFRTHHHKEMINDKEDSSYVEGTIDNDKTVNRYKVCLTQGFKSVFINDSVINKISSYVGKVNAICFAPNDVGLFKESPTVRRNFLDKELSCLFPIYVKQLIIYQQVLDERNNLLKGKIDYDLLSVLDDKLVESSFDVYKRRKWLIEKVEEFSTKIYKYITGKEGSLKIEYHTYLDNQDKDKYLIKAKEIYNRNIKKDIERTFTSVGIHKDDFVVYLDGKQIDMYASQGQQRLISLCMKLAVVEITSKLTKSDPLIILDDAFSELDASKKEKLLNYVANKKQVFVTCTDYKNIVGNANCKYDAIKIQNGTVIERKSV